MLTKEKVNLPKNDSYHSSTEINRKARRVKIGLLGASFDTGNLGVSALAESSIKIILCRWPDVEITLIGSGYVPGELQLRITGKDICIKTIPIRFSKNVLLPYHFLVFMLYSLLTKMLPSSALKTRLVNSNQYFRMLTETELVVDITAGDSFSDIYGFRRFFLGFLRKWLIIFLGKKIVLLPQTYGPFKKHFTKIMARYIMSQADIIYSRDQVGVETIRNLLDNRCVNGQVRFAPDVAFILNSRKPYNINDLFEKARAKDSIVVGLNISGLLFNGGYTQDNMFGLRTDYRKSVYSIIDFIMQNQKSLVLLIPHVFQPAGYIESDSDVCLQVYNTLKEKFKNRLFFVHGQYNQNEIKYIIGMCDLFIGSRLHACIAAMSQSIPTVGLGYSKKFEGVFETIGAKQFVVDMRQVEAEEILTTIAKAFEQREVTARHLRTVIPEVQKKTLNVLKDIL